MQIQIIQLMLTHIKIFPTKNTKWKSHCQPKKKKGLNMLKQKSQDSGNMKKGKIRMSWAWKMKNDYYRIRKKAHNHGKWGMKQNSTNSHGSLELGICQ